MKRGSNRGEKHTREKMKKIVTLKTIINKALMLYLDGAEEEQFINSINKLIYEYNSNRGKDSKECKIIPLIGEGDVWVWREVCGIVSQICNDEGIPIREVIRYIKGMPYLVECRKLNLSKSCFYDKIKNIYSNIKDYLFYYKILIPTLCIGQTQEQEKELFVVQIYKFIKSFFCSDEKKGVKIIFEIDRLICRKLEESNFRTDCKTIMKGFLTDDEMEKLQGYFFKVWNRSRSLREQCA